MLSYEVREYYSFLNKEIKEFEPFIEIILEFSDKYKENTTECLKKILSTSNTNITGSMTYYGVNGGKIIENFKNVIKNFKNTFNFFEVFSKYSILKNDINKYIENNNIEDESIIQFFLEVDNFFESYQSFMQSDNDIKLAIDFGQSVKEFERTYKTLKLSYKEIEKKLLDVSFETYEESNLKKIDIQLLGIEYSFEDFVSKLNIINNIYCEIGNVIYTNETFEKLRIIKIESGSLLSIILGDKNIIEALSTLLNKSVNMVFNKFTYEGKIYRHSEFRNELLADVEATKRLKELGYDTEEAQKNNNEALTLLTKDLLKLSKSSSKIKIDNNEYDMKDENKIKFLESYRILQLESGEEKNK